METLENLATGYGLIEGPVWDDSRGLIYSDVINGGVFCVGLDDSISQVIEHRRGIGGMALHENGGIVVSGRNISLKPADGGDTVVLLADNPDGGRIGFNDITTDAKGRIAIDWGVYGVPETFIIDKLGRIRYKHVGPIMPFQYEKTIKPLLDRLAR